MSGPVRLGGGPRGPSPSTMARLKGVVRSELCLGTDVPIVIHEAACTEPGCAPVETMIAVLDGSDRTYRVPLPLADVTPQGLRRLLDKEHAHDHDH